ncbi:MAG: DUF362 domain-containing protein [Bacteroidales bacterium]|nr:DUF362 domain-containing protein [Bacteroidales bacterium]
MRRRTFLFSLISVAILICSCSGTKNVQQVNTGFGDSKEGATVYFTSDISPKGLVEIYKALGVKPEGRVAVKISTGESSKSNHLRPELIADLVHEVNGTLVECNTAYGGSRATTEAHRKAIKERGFEVVAPVDIMDAEEDIQIPVKDKSHIQYDIVGSHIKNYDFVINLAHFKGHAMGGFGGVLKNQSIGFASSAGKLYIHSAGRTTTKWLDDDQDGFLASTDPVALDQACIDLVFNHKDTEGDTASPLQQRINRQHGLHILEHAEKIGLGGRKYMLKNIDKR